MNEQVIRVAVVEDMDDIRDALRIVINGYSDPAGYSSNLCYGNRYQWVEICVDESAVDAHLAHGDDLGGCGLKREGYPGRLQFQFYPHGSFTF